MNIISDSPLTKRIQRWKIMLQEYDYKFDHVKGTQNHMADAVSRIFSLKEQGLSKIVSIKEVSNWQRKYLRKRQSDEINLDKDSGLWCDKENRVLIPKEVTTKFIQSLHNELLHPGENKLY